MDIGFLEMLKLLGFDDAMPFRLVRHTSKEGPIDEFRRRGWLDLYQSYHGKPVYGDAKQIISFYALPGTRACFYGVYEVLGCRPAEQGAILAGCPLSEVWRRQSNCFYELKHDERFDSLRDRLIIEWGPGVKAFVQKGAEKPVLEIRASGRKLPPFDDYLEFSLAFSELKDLFSNEEAHKDWKASLNAVAGVYLILDETTGELYVGSAYGVGGIWARWREYARTRHGGNKALRELIKHDPGYPENFRFSILQILPKTMTKEEIIGREAKYKVKLGSRAHGLNCN
jgi:hypothetical protein